MLDLVVGMLEAKPGSALLCVRMAAKQYLKSCASRDNSDTDVKMALCIESCII